jgi:multiple sugar transport system substrate-binding protein
VKTLNRRDFLKGLSVTALAGVAAACSAPAQAPAQAPAATAAPAAPTAAPAAQKITLRFHHRVGGECDHYTFEAGEFMKANPNIELKAECFPGADYFQKLNTLAAGGTLGDLWWVSSIEGYYRMAATGVSAPIDDLIKADNYDLGQLYKQNVEGARLKGVLHGLPQLAHPGRTGLFYYKPVFDAAKVAYPDEKWTYDDMMANAKKLTDPTNQVFGFMDPERSYFSVLVYLRAYGGDVINEDGTKCPLNSDKAKAGLQYISDLYNKEKVSDKPGASTMGAQQLCAANKLAMYQSGFWGFTIKDYVKEGTWGVSHMPYGPTGKQGSMFEMDPLCLSTTSQHKAEAFKFMELIASHDAQMRYFEKGSAPSPRPDVMNDPKLQADQTMKVFAATMADAGPLILPANFRETEYFKYIGEALSAIWLGEKTVDQILDETTKGAQAILDKPSLATS